MNFTFDELIQLSEMFEQFQGVPKAQCKNRLTISVLGRIITECQYLTNIFRGRIEYEQIYSLRGAKHQVDYSVHIQRDRERYLFYYTENY